MNAGATKARAFDWRRALAMDTQITQLLAITVIVFVVMAALSPEKFLRAYNFESITFTLDGVPVTAEDFVFAIRRLLDPKTAAEYASVLYPIKNALKVNTSGGSFWGNSASLTFENSVRYHGIARFSSSAFSPSTGVEVSCRGGNFGGKTTSRKLLNTDCHHGRVSWSPQSCP